MLKRFSVENFASFDAEQNFDLTAGSTKTLGDHVVKFGKVGILRTGVVYGANASGKSNLIKAVDFARRIILKGLKGVNSYKKHFRLKEGTAGKNSSFEFEVEINGRFYSYGFSCVFKLGKVTEEWLYEVGSGEPKKIFSREGNNIEVGPKLRSGSNYKRFEIYIDDMKNQAGQLFLSELAEKELVFDDIEDINNVYDWFENKLEIIYPDDRYCGVRGINENLIEELSRYLDKFDTGIVAIESVEEDFEVALKEIPEVVKDAILKDFNSEKATEAAVLSNGGDAEFLTLRKTSDDGVKVRKLAFTHGNDFKESFELREESDGTKRLIDFIPLIGRFLSDHTILIDEFDRSLHPKLTKQFFDIFHSIQDKNSQLIVTTHESTLLDLSTFRRDEVWFVEKSADHSSKLFSLNAFKERYDRRIEKAYLLGRYGAIPIFKSFDNFDLGE